MRKPFPARIIRNQKGRIKTRKQFMNRRTKVFCSFIEREVTPKKFFRFSSELQPRTRIHYM